MEGIAVGVFGTDSEAKDSFKDSVAKRSEAEGIGVHTRVESGRRYSFLDTGDYPARIQGYARIASLVDHALYFYPRQGKLAPPDGELAVLLGAYRLPGTLELVDGSALPDDASASLKGTVVASYPIEERVSKSQSIDLSKAVPRADFPTRGTLIYVDRAFTVKGVGTVALGFVLSGTVKVHDPLRPVPGPDGARAEVKGIQVNDVDFESAGRGIRVGLSLRGVEPKELGRAHWLEDSSFVSSDVLTLDFDKSQFYRQEVAPRDLHLQLPGELVPAGISSSPGGQLSAKLPWPVPSWAGMKTALVDLNGGSLRVAGGATSTL